jgi:hypothetical protein
MTCGEKYVKGPRETANTQRIVGEIIRGLHGRNGEVEVETLVAIVFSQCGHLDPPPFPDWQNRWNA